MIEEIEQLARHSDWERFVIAVCSTKSQEAYWQLRLNSRAVEESLLPRGLRVAVVREDWAEGAGNGLGTLNAFRLGSNQFLKRDGIDLFQRLQEGASCTIYHTAGRGKRLYPLTASEGGDKSRILLPSTRFPNSGDCMTLLELVIRQTQPLCRRGRIATFWGDQLFIPSKRPPTIDRDLPIELLICRCPSPQPSKWSNCGFENYGIVRYTGDGEAISMLDKLSEETYTRLHASELFQWGMGLNLGAFSLSPAAIQTLLDEFKGELEEKRGRFDSDPELWAPLTMDWELFSQLKGGENARHFERMQRMKERWEERHGSRFGPSAYDVGCNCNWWDFGSVRLFHDNLLKVLKEGEEAEHLRRLLGVENGVKMSELGEQVETDESSLIIGSKIQSGRIKNSILIGVEADEVTASNSVIIKTRCRTLTALEGVVYRANSSSAIDLPKYGVRADCELSGEWIPTETSLDRDAKMEWDEHRPNERYSYRELAERMLEFAEG